MTTATTQSLTEAQRNYRHDEKRIRSRKAALLDLLLDRKWHPNWRCAEVGGLSFNSYLYQLRQAGWEIESRHVRGGVWEQRLIGKRDTPSLSRDGLSRPQRRVVDDLTLAVRKVYGDDGLERIREVLSPWLTDALSTENE
jgi:hypothetical protein